MGFMQAQITDKQYWVMVDGDNGIDCVPGDLVHIDRLRKLLKIDSDEARADAFAMIEDYVESSKGAITIVYGYGVRSSAPGYMDCTPWEVYLNKRDAMRAYREHERESR